MHMENKHPLIHKILLDKNIKDAYDALMNKTNTSGKDGMMLSDVYEYYQLNKESIKKSILNKTFQCQMIMLNEMLDYKGKHRIIAKLCSIDRLLARAITQILSKELDYLFSSYSFAYRENMGVQKAIQVIFEYVKDNQYVCSIDIENFFDEINHSILLKELHKIINDDILEYFISCFMKCEIEYDYMTSYKSKGLIQGNSLSPFLSNLYLHSLDKHLENKNIEFVRFADNIFLFFKEKHDAYNYINHVKQILESRYLLKINKRKSGVFESHQARYLGYFIQFKNGHYEIIKNKREKQGYYSSWYTSPLRYINHQYHLIDDGILRKKDYHLLFENEQQKVEIPIEVTDHINVHSNIIFSSLFFELMSQQNLIVNIFNSKGMYLGQYIPQKSKRNIYTTLNQATIYNNEEKRIDIAKKIVNASIHNERSNIKYYYKHNKDPHLKEIIDQLTELLKQVNECYNYEKLLLVEARAKHIYFQSFPIIIENKDFTFQQRSKQPPLDNINALISFGNTVLYNMIANEIFKTTLDIRIGFLHASNHRKQSLNLDIADIFKPIIIDRVIFTMINKKIINKNHYENRNKGVYLTSEGKSIFIKQINKKLYDHIHYHHQRITYSSLIRNNIYTLLQHINNNKKIKFYKYR